MLPMIHAIVYQVQGFKKKILSQMLLLSSTIEQQLDIQLVNLGSVEVNLDWAKLCKVTS